MRKFPVALLTVVLCGACGSNSSSSGGGPIAPTPTPPTPPAATVVALALTGDTLLPAPGQTVQLTITASMSDLTQQTVTSEASWESSAAHVVAVSTAGVLTAVSPGSAKITATFGGKSASADVIVPIVGGRQRTVRLMYLVPTDRQHQVHYRKAIQTAFVSLQAWYRDQLGGQVFSLASLSPDECGMLQPSSFYAVDTYSKVFAEARRCGPVTAGSSQNVVWIVYADVVHGCNQPGRIGVGSPGLAVLGREDIQGLAGEPSDGDCGRNPSYPVGRYIGGAGHELGHAFGLPHPPGCDAGSQACDWPALMWAGYASYPNTYLRDDEKQKLRESPFFRPITQSVWDEAGLPRYE